MNRKLLALIAVAGIALYLHNRRQDTLAQRYARVKKHERDGRVIHDFATDGAFNLGASIDLDPLSDQLFLDNGSWLHADGSVTHE